MESFSGDYEDYEDWSPMDAVLEDMLTDMKQEPRLTLEETPLVSFIKQQKKPTHLGAAKLIAEKFNMLLKDLFPFHAGVHVDERRAVKKKSAPSSKVQEIPEYIEGCMDICKYVVMDTTELYYFEEGRKYAEARCRACAKRFATATNKKVEGTNDLLSPPSQSNAVYVCPTMVADKCRCGGFCCVKCFSAMGRPSRRRR